MSHPMTPPAPLPVSEAAQLQAMLREPSGRRSAGYPALPARIARAISRPFPAGRYRADGAR